MSTTTLPAEQAIPRISLTRAEAAEAMSTSVVTLDRMINRGELRAYHFGRGVRIKAADLEAAMVPIPTVGTINAGLV